MSVTLAAAAFSSSRALRRGAGDRDDVLAARQHPGERELRRGEALRLRERLDPGDEREVRLQVLALEARVDPAPVVGGELAGGTDRPRQEAAPERAVGDEADAELADRRRGSRPRGRASRASTRSAARRSGGRRARGGSSSGAGLATARGSGPCPPSPARPSRRRSPRSAPSGRRGAGSRGRCVSTPSRFSEASQRLAHVVRRPADAEERAVRRRARCRTSSRARRVAPALRIARPDELLVVEGAVHVGGVEEGDAEVERAVDRRDRLRRRRGGP